MSGFEIEPIEMLALRKLVIVNHALAATLTGRASQEQHALVGVLDDVLNRYEIERAKARASIAG